MSRLFHHWELKLVAVVVAIALYTYTSGQVRVDRMVPVAVSESAVRGLPGDIQVSAIEPREFKVQLSVPTNRLGDLDEAGLSPRLELLPEQVAPGELKFPLTSQILSLPNDVRILATEPADLRELTIHLDRIADAELPVEPPKLVGLPSGLEAELNIQPTMVHVRAASAVLERLVQEHHHVRFLEIPLGHIPPGLIGEQKETSQLIALTAPSESPYVVVGKVEASIVIQPLPGLRRSVSVPVRILIRPEFLKTMKVELTTTTVTVEIRGPENLLRGITGENDLLAMVQVEERLEQGVAHRLPVVVTAPPGVVVDGPQNTALITVFSGPAP